MTDNSKDSNELKALLDKLSNDMGSYSNRIRRLEIAVFGVNGDGPGGLGSRLDELALELSGVRRQSAVAEQRLDAKFLELVEVVAHLRREIDGLKGGRQLFIGR
jgi:hypothetical protein